MPKTVKNMRGPGLLALQIMRARAAQYKKAWLLAAAQGCSDADARYDIYTAYESAAGIIAAVLDGSADAVLEYDCEEAFMPAMLERCDDWVAWNNQEARQLYKKPD